MKKAHIISLFAVLTLFIFSCKKECSQWYEGKDCKTEIRQKYYGTYTGTRTIVLETGTSIENNTQIVLGENTKGAQFLTDIGNNIYLEIKNKQEYGLPADSSPQLRVASQDLNVNGTTYTVFGTGSLNDNTLTYSFSIFSPNGSGGRTLTFEGLKP
jgi:hypothetical protein